VFGEWSESLFLENYVMSFTHKMVIINCDYELCNDLALPSPYVKDFGVSWIVNSIFIITLTAVF
jgi:hypothetical protein